MTQSTSSRLIRFGEPRRGLVDADEHADRPRARRADHGGRPAAAGAGLLSHSDRGSQCTSDDYQRALRMLLEYRAPQLRSGRSSATSGKTLEQARARDHSDDDSARPPVFAILFDMNALWERYVTWLFRRACPAGSTVAPQGSTPFWRPLGQAARQVRPDLLVRDRAGRGVLVADAKWKVPSGGPSIDDLKQMFVYNELFKVDHAVLVYPSRTGASAQSGCYLVDRAHRCETIHLDLFDAEGWNRGSAMAQAQIAALVAASAGAPRAAPATPGRDL